MLIRATHFLSPAIVFVLMGGCAPAYPGGAVVYAAEAAALAKHKCSSGGKELFGVWRAKLDGNTWTVSFGSNTNSGFSVAIDAQTGVVGRCHLPAA